MEIVVDINQGTNEEVQPLLKNETTNQDHPTSDVLEGSCSSSCECNCGDCPKCGVAAVGIATGGMMLLGGAAIATSTNVWPVIMNSSTTVAGIIQHSVGSFAGGALGILGFHILA